MRSEQANARAARPRRLPTAFLTGAGRGKRVNRGAGEWRADEVSRFRSVPSA
jgi:hypothetical protein